ncbi:Thioesterase domain-containing protein [Madurella fahalii]|uniref:Thioesterase domain-containing protein n=1 Tax=Madurella fahalii TaxID=1157608 RepID=A0ABQ0GK79_9PEZI
MASILKRQLDLRRVSADTYTVSWHADWTVGATLQGGCVAAAIHLTAATHLTTDPELAAKKQPDILKMHLQFLRQCGRRESTITVSVLRTGAATSTLQLQFSQKGQIKVLAIVTSINFDKPLGPSVPAAWTLLPPPKPKPDLKGCIAARRPDGNWLPARMSGEILNVTGNMLVLNPRGGFPVDGIHDAWYGFTADHQHERMDPTYLAFMADIIPSMSDTLMRNRGLYDAHAFSEKLERWADENPGVPAEITTTLAEALRAKTFNATVTLDIEFKRKVPAHGLEWVFTRTVTKMLEGGRMDLDITICNEKMELVCTAQQLVFVLEAERKFNGGRKGKAEGKAVL